MSERTFKVPEGMIHAAMKPLGWHPDRYSARTGAFEEGVSVSDMLEGALLWLDARLKEEEDPERRFYYAIDGATDYWLQGWKAAIKQVRSMFLAPEPEISEEIKDLLVDDYAGSIGEAAQRNRDVIEAYRRGKASR